MSTEPNVSISERRTAALEALNQFSESDLTPQTVENVRFWLTQDRFADDWPALLDLVEARQFQELTRLFWERIPFGTGGRRGAMSTFGTATINRWTIAESAWGLGQYVLQSRELADTTTSTTTSASRPRAVIAFDGRLRSPEFAEVSASVLAALGFEVFLYAEPRATPQLSFSVRRLNCDCGIMISASHNPPGDNGFKAYWSNGVQVLPPHDAGIIDWVNRAESIAFAERAAAESEGTWRAVPAGIDDDYINAVAALSRTDQRAIKVLFTPLHGVGGSSIVRVLQRAGFDDVEVYTPQATVDGNFPNVPDQLPNPERAAVLWPAIQYAESQGNHDLVLASDPDADRLAAAVRTRENRYAILTGNQLGSLLADFAITQNPASAASGYVLQTLVTTPLISAIATAAGATVYADAPVGFKHLGAAMEAHGPEGLIFAAEESLGYLAGDYCRDKDAALAALWCCEQAAILKAAGASLLDRLQSLYRERGWYRESQVSHVFTGPTGAAHMAAVIARFRERPPTQIGTAPVQRIRDYGRQVVRAAPGWQVTESLSVQAGELLFADVRQDGVTGQVALRPSGTEPKLKCYFFAQSPSSMPFHEGEQRTLDLLKELESGLESWLKSAV